MITLNPYRTGQHTHTQMSDPRFTISQTSITI